MGNKLAPLALLGLALSVPYFIGYLSHANGLLPLVDTIVASGKLPDGTPIRTHWFGLPNLDRLTTALVAFFWPAAAALHPALLVHSIAFSGTFGATFALMTLESWRSGNAWTLSGFSLPLGLAAQVLTIAFSMPTYGLLHLLTSTTASTPSRANMRIPYAVLLAFPAVWFVGNGVPSLAMTLPYSARNTVAVKQLITALWQPWPAYTSFGLLGAHLLLGGIFTAGDAPTPAGRKASASALRWIYGTLFGLAAVPHVVAVTVSAATVFAPKIFSPTYVAALHPAVVLDAVLPWSPSPIAQIKTLGDGVHAFLGWDYKITAASVLLWTSVLHARAHKYYEGKCVSLLPFLGKLVMLVAMAGPGAAAVQLMWEREELILQSEDKQLASKKRS